MSAPTRRSFLSSMAAAGVLAQFARSLVILPRADTARDTLAWAKWLVQALASTRS
jgi:hypothetical protein